MSNNRNQVRIIAGKYKGRKISFANSTNLRPTPNRIRETLFNWLMSNIQNASVLDLFSGSGALGFEALSRGANSVILIEKEKHVAKKLHQESLLFQSENIKVINSDALEYLSSTKIKFDIVFLDPPFHQELLNPCIQKIMKYKILNQNALIYIESSQAEIKKIIPKNWGLLKEKKAGQVFYRLYTNLLQDPIFE